MAQNPSQTPTVTPTLPTRWASDIAVASTDGSVLAPPDDFEKSHHVRRAEEVETDDILRARSDRSNRINIQRRSVAGEDSARLCDAVELREDIPFHGHVLKNRLNNEIGIGKLCQIGLSANSRSSRRQLGFRQRLLRTGAFVDLANSAEAAS